MAADAYGIDVQEAHDIIAPFLSWLLENSDAVAKAMLRPEGHTGPTGGEGMRALNRAMIGRLVGVLSVD